MALFPRHHLESNDTSPDQSQALRDPESGIATHDRRVDHHFVRGVFSGLDAVEWFVNNMQGVQTLGAAQAVGQKFLALGLLVPVAVTSSDFEASEQVGYYHAVMFIP